MFGNQQSPPSLGYRSSRNLSFEDRQSDKSQYQYKSQSTYPDHLTSTPSPHDNPFGRRSSLSPVYTPFERDFNAQRNATNPYTSNYSFSPQGRAAQTQPREIDPKSQFIPTLLSDAFSARSRPSSTRSPQSPGGLNRSPFSFGARSRSRSRSPPREFSRNVRFQETPRPESPRPTDDADAPPSQSLFDIDFGADDTTTANAVGGRIGGAYGSGLGPSRYSASSSNPSAPPTARRETLQSLFSPLQSSTTNDHQPTQTSSSSSSLPSEDDAKIITITGVSPTEILNLIDEFRKYGEQIDTKHKANFVVIKFRDEESARKACRKTHVTLGSGNICAVLKGDVTGLMRGTPEDNIDDGGDRTVGMNTVGRSGLRFDEPSLLNDETPPFGNTPTPFTRRSIFTDRLRTESGEQGFSSNGTAQVPVTPYLSLPRHMRGATHGAGGSVPDTPVREGWMGRPVFGSGVETPG
ncbi:hypothetical protein HK097_005296, partial [Rhizophlyctis rosea]